MILNKPKILVRPDCLYAAPGTLSRSVFQTVPTAHALCFASLFRAETPVWQSVRR